MDGTGPLRFLRDIVLPVSGANIAALFVILFVYGWNHTSGRCSPPPIRGSTPS